MSHWDFSRLPRGDHDAPPPGPAGTTDEPDLMAEADDAWATRDARQAQGSQPVEAGWPDDGSWLAGPEGTPDEGWPSGDAWDGDTLDDDAWDDDEGMAPYPVTYERDDFLDAAPEQAGQPAPEQAPPPAVPWEPWPPAADPEPPGAADAADTIADGQGASPWPGAVAGGQRWDGWRAGFAGLGRPGAGAAGPGWPDAGPGLPGAPPAGRGDGRRGGRRWLVMTGVIVAGAAVGAAAVLLAERPPASQAGRSGQAAGPPATPAARASASPSAAAALTLAQAQAVLAGYTTANNNANAQRSDALLAAAETGSSYAIDAGLYQSQQGTAPYPAFTAVQATYYIPRGEPATGPRWFVVQVANAFTSSPAKVTSKEYLLFTQATAGGPWQDAVEPYLLSGANAPQIAVGTDGLATAVSPDATSVAVAPAQLATVTAASADGTATGTGQPAVPAPGNLADVNDQQFWQGKLPGGKVTDAHTPATGTAGQAFAVATADGGALVFYTDAAQLTITPPAGAELNLTIPGFYSPSQSLSVATVSYLEQFATYDPPAGGKAPTVIADYSGITGTG